MPLPTRVICLARVIRDCDVVLITAHLKPIWPLTLTLNLARNTETNYRYVYMVRIATHSSHTPCMETCHTTFHGLFYRFKPLSFMYHVQDRATSTQAATLGHYALDSPYP